MGFGGFCGFLTNHLEVFWFEICYFYISQTKSSLDKIFYKFVHHYIIYMCDFLVNLDDFFVVICTDFHKIVVFTRYVPFLIFLHDKLLF